MTGSSPQSSRPKAISTHSSGSATFSASNAALVEVAGASPATSQRASRPLRERPCLSRPWQGHNLLLYACRHGTTGIHVPPYCTSSITLKNRIAAFSAAVAASCAAVRLPVESM